MTVFGVLAALFGALQLLPRFGLTWLPAQRDKARGAVALMFIFSGTVLHFLAAEKLLPMLPPPLPRKRELVFLSGLGEILGGIGLLLPRTRGLAARGLIALLVAVFPANVYVALANVPLGGYMNSPVYQWLRLPFQPLLMAWVWWSAR